MSQKTEASHEKVPTVSFSAEKEGVITVDS